MHEYGSLPRARQDGLLEEAVGEELLLYDQNTHTAHCLSPVAACVWRHCDGERDVTELAKLARTSESLVADTLDELREKDLVDAGPVLMQGTVAGVSRREAIGRVVRVGAAAAAAPLIVSATAATPAMAASGETTACESQLGSKCCKCNDGDCKSGLSATQCEQYCSEGTRGGLHDCLENHICMGG